MTTASSEEMARRDLAMLTIERGVEGFAHGSLPITQIELPAEPTLDDMLAAEFLTWLIAGEQLPEGAEALARYAKLAREGLRLGALPLESSLEGIYQAVRNSVKEDLTQPQNAAAFLSAWQPLAKRLRQAAEAGQDPFTARLFDDVEFSRERAFLQQDHKVYRQDVARGERWRIKMPGGPPEASALILREPKSLLFKHWSREDAATPTGEPYLLMGVQWGAGDWVFSTDPVQRISLKELADRLQAAENEKDPASAKADPWFDGAPFGHTLVASPKGLSKLGDQQILGIARAWAGGKVERPNRKPPIGIPVSALYGGIAAMALVAVSMFAMRFFKDRPIEPLGLKALEPVIETAPPFATSASHAHFELKPEADAEQTILVTSPCHVPRPVRLKLLVDAVGCKPDRAVIHVNGGLPQTVLLSDEKGRLCSTEFTSHFTEKTNRVTIRLDNPGSVAATAKARLQWTWDSKFLPKLHLLAIGVSDYEHPDIPDLTYADDDAEEMVPAFKPQEGSLFCQVSARRLVNADASRDNVLAALELISKEAQPNDLVVVTVSGHGMQGKNGRFYFLPHDFNPELPQASRGVEWDQFLEHLENLHCNVVIVMDTCHSGTISAGGLKSVDQDAFSLAIQDAIKRSYDNPKGIVVLAACLSHQKARENGTWKHGALSLAFLEAVRGVQFDGKPIQRMEPDNPIVSLEDISHYVNKRVPQLVGSDQAVSTKPLTGSSLSLIPMLAIMPPDSSLPLVAEKSATK